MHLKKYVHICPPQKLYVALTLKYQLWKPISLQVIPFLGKLECVDWILKNSGVNIPAVQFRLSSLMQLAIINLILQMFYLVLMRTSLALYLEAVEKYLLSLKHLFKAQSLSLISLESMVKIHHYHQLYFNLKLLIIKLYLPAH